MQGVQFAPGHGSLMTSYPMTRGSLAKRAAILSNASHVVVLQSDAVGPRIVRPEVLERALHGGVQDVVQRKGRVGRVRQPVGDRHPVRQAVAVEQRREAVLMEVEQHEEMVARERVDRLGDVLDVAVVDLAGSRHETLHHDAQAHRVEAQAFQECGVVVAEAEGRGIERRRLRRPR